jgi:hypothetical protein
LGFLSGCLSVSSWVSLGFSLRIQTGENKAKEKEKQRDSEERKQEKQRSRKKQSSKNA